MPLSSVTKVEENLGALRPAHRRIADFNGQQTKAPNAQIFHLFRKH
jgi:hypothetical protein